MILYLGIALLCAALPIAVYAIGDGGGKGGKKSAQSLIGPSKSGIDLREAMLSQSAKERALAPALNSVALKLKGITPAGWVSRLEGSLSQSGLGSKWTIERMMLIKLVGTVLGCWFSFSWWQGHGFSGMDMLYEGLGVFLGFRGPDLWVESKAKKRTKQIGKELADVLDQITVGVEAGLGFDAAMARSARSNEGPLAEELTRTLQHVTAGLSRAEALRGLANRNKVPELRQFVGAILQAEQFGIPMAQVLRVQSADMRRRRRQAAEEKAMKLPVKILFPLVLCILPTLFVVLIGPAGLRMKNNL